ncbi:MAG: HAMP domain-containing sensor histidine kinase [Kofleriaceae bacterium]
MTRAPSGRRRRGAGDDPRVEVLEAELKAARRTVDVLIARSERRAVEPSQAELFEVAARMEQEIEQRTQELEATRAEFEALTGNLDQIVRQRTRALAESEAQLLRKNAELERQSQLKAEFISIVAHELRTPLVSIVGYLDLLVEGKFGSLDEAQERPVASLKRNAHRLKRLVDEMLDFSRLEAGRARLTRGPVRLDAVVTDAVTELQPLADRKRQAVTTELAAIAPLSGDSDKIHQIVINLVSNAIRYTPDGGAIRVTVDDAPPAVFAGDWARLRVRDNGIGIPAAHRHRIFEPFTDVQPAKHHTSAGPDSAGLGLFIARGLVELHGGLITVESEEAVFTEFTVLLPRAS